MKKKLSKQELALKKIAAALQAYVNDHIANIENPHGVTKTQIGLGNVTNDAQVKRSEMGANNGVATLGSNGKVISSQLPSYTLDNVLDGSNRKIPTKVSELTNDSGFLTGHQSLVDYATKTFVENKFKDAFGINASGVSDLAAILTDEDYTTGILNVIANKVDKVSGKGLSTNDYTTTEKNKLSGIESGAQVHIAPTATEVKSALGTGSGTSKYLREDGTWQTPPDTWRPVSDSISSTSSSDAASSKAVKTAYDLAASKTANTGTVTSVAIKMNGTTKGTVTTSGTIDLGTIITAHQDISGKVDKTTTVNGHALSGNVSVTKSDVGLGNVGDFKAVSTVVAQGLTSTEQANARANIGAGTSSFSGSYNDLSNKPTLFSGSYNDLSNKPTIPSLSGYATESWVSSKINDLIGIDASGVEALKTALSDNDTATGLLTAIAGKVDKNGTDRLMTAAEGTKLSNIESGALVHKAPTTAEVKSALGTGSGTSKYLREDGTWVTPPNDNTTYKLTINSVDNGGGSTSLGSIYAPTSAGTSGQILISSGSGAPTWSAAPAAATIGYTTVDEDVTDINASVATQIATLNANALLKTSLSLTSGEQSLILTNLGISSLNTNALLKTSQNLSSSEKTLILTNLGITLSLLRTITISTSEPTNSDGNDGDIWLVYES